MIDIFDLLCIGLVGILAFIAGVIFDRIVAHLPIHVGSLVLNYDDPNKDFLGFVFTRDLDLSDIVNSEYVSFKVVVEGSPDSNPKFPQGENS